ncbi:ABC transporter permease [Microbacterium nanhaiense]|uniref:ABC transporter permease n=2 Tax=Microbacterium nanhaiense TaxID=1301026 RepID=A0ABQ2N3V8_9MICO|nr:ABC transporter permease [Microbacterium nanhaiense]
MAVAVEPPARAVRAPLLRLVGRRALWGIPVCFAVTFAVFVLAAIAPSGAVSSLLGGNEEFVAGQARADAQETTSIGNPVIAWVRWLGHAMTGDLGWSAQHRQTVVEVVGSRLGWTLLLMMLGFIVGGVLSLALALAAALPAKSLLAQAASRLIVRALLALSAFPSFVISLGLVAVFAVGLNWLPAGGLVDLGAPRTADQLVRHLIMPVTAIALAQLPWMTLHLHTGLREGTQSRHAQAARFRGVPERRILMGLVLPEALIPVLAIAGARLPEVIAGAVLVEEIFAIPGIGRELIDAALSQDVYVISVISALLAAVAIIGGALADLLLARIDPRVSADDL